MYAKNLLFIVFLVIICHNLGNSMPAFGDLTVATCDNPVNYKDCSRECEDLTSCKRCCADFDDPWFDKCINRCNVVFDDFVEPPPNENE